MKNGNITTKNLVYTIMEGGKERNILDGIDCEIPQGKLTTISGPSGSGKTTFMYALSGLLESVKGNVVYGDESLYEMNFEERDKFRLENISFIFQHLNLMGFMNVEENIKLSQILRSEKTNKEFEDKIDEYLKIMNLGDIRKKSVQALSGGEKQRVAIIRAFMSGAKVIFADEPTGNLDSKNSSNFMECLKKIMEINDVTVVLVTHDKEIFKYGDKQILIEDGKLLETV